MFSILPSLPRPIVKAIVGIWRRRWLVLALAWLVAISGWLATTLIPDMYESRAQVYINTDTGLDTTIADVGARPDLEKQVRIIRTQLLSRDNIERVIYEVGLDASISSPVELERKIDDLAGRIKVQSDEDQYFTITHLNTDPVMAQRIVAAVLDLFVEQNLSTALADANSTISYLDQEIAVRKKELDAAAEKIADFRRDNADELAGSQQLAARIQSKREELSRLQDQIASATMRRERVASTLAGTKRYTSGSNLDTLKLELASLQTQFNDNYPDIVRLKAQIEQLESGSAALPENPEFLTIRDSLRQATDELRGLRGRAERTQRDIDDLTLKVAQTPEAESELMDLVRAHKQIERVYTELLDRRTRADIRANANQTGGAIQYQRFEAPKVAAEPSWPPRGLMSLAIMVVGLGFGGAVAFVLTQLDQTYTQASDLEEALGLPVLGAVSQSPTRQHIVKVFFDRLALGLAMAVLLVTAVALYWFFEVRIAAGPDEVQASVVPAVRTAGGIR